MKRIVSLLLVLVLCCTMLPQVILKADAASTYVINGVSVRYDNFTSSKSECWDYANNLYNKIWGMKFNNKFDDSSNSLRNLSDSELTLTQAHLKAYVTNAKLGSCLRICDSKYLHGNDGWGHSQIIVQKDANGFTVLEGGLTAAPHCREKYYTWSSYCSTWDYEYIKYIKWPSAPAYVACDHKYNDSGYCKNTGCGIEYDYMSSWNTSEAGYYKVTTSSGIKMRTGPYQARSTTGGTIAYGTQVRVIGSLENHFGNKWYQFEVNGIKGYTYESHLTLVKYLDQSITGTITDPVAGERIPQGKHPVAGTITSHNYPLKEVKAYLDGSCYATVTLGKTNTLDVRSTDINAKLSFGSLSLGEHTLVIKARDIHHSTLSTVCTVKFTTVCGTHSYTSKVTKAATCTTAGVRTYTCSKCGDSYPETIPATGIHSYSGWVTVTTASCTASGVQKNVCSVCGNTQTQSIAATGHNYSEWTTVTAATCTAAGTQQKACYSCGDTQYQAIPALGYHSYGEWVTVTAPTCTESGTQKTTCTVCGDVQTQTVAATKHIYLVADKIGATCTEFEKTCYTCMKCQASYEEYTGNTYAAHNYQNGRCVHCQAADPDYVITDAALRVESKTARAGSTVQVAVSIKNNPGIWGMDLIVEYDKSLLTLTGVTNGTVFTSSEWTQGNLSGDQYILSYEASGFENITADGVLAVLEFKVSENATIDSVARISLSYDAGDIISVDFADVDFTVTSGEISVADFVYGDLNGDGLVNKKDSLLMKMYLADNTTTIDMQAADVYADGSVNKKDSLYLKQYLAGWDVVLGA